ncbi:MAG: calcium/sodium antiporter [Clostridia bacterium]|nr:calcium/sodium antiporter [Clostridia bacterium]
MVGESILQIVLLIVGFVLLIRGADFLVDGASGLAGKLNISTFVIGLTVVAIGTSAPEIAVSIVAGIEGNGEIIVGNVVGSNIMNILLILGITSLICSLPIGKTSRHVELPFLIVITGVFIGLAYWNGGFQWWDGLILLMLYVVFMVYTVLMARHVRRGMLSGAAPENVEKLEVSSPKADIEADIKEMQSLSGMKRFRAGYRALKHKTWFLTLITLFGLLCIVGGAECVVDAAEFIAEDLFHIPASIVALTVVAFGTSLPELVTSISAARKGDTSLATGNIIGSNIANLLLVAGFGFVCSSETIAFSTTDLIDILASLFAAALLLVCVLCTKKKALNRRIGIIMLVCLVAYYTWLFVNLGYGFV